MRKNKGSTLAEFVPGLILVISLFLVVASISWYLVVQVALKYACESAATRASACYGEQQARQIVQQVNGQFHTGIIGVLVANNSEQDGLSLEIMRTKAPDNSGSYCRVFGQYHVHVLFCPWLVVASSDATSVLEHPEGYIDVAQN